MAEAMLEGARAAAEDRSGTGAARSSGLARTISVKVTSASITLFVLLVGNFFLFRVLPADPAKNLTHNSTLTAKQLAAINRTFGLGLPLPRQFWNYLVQTFHDHPRQSFVNLL